MICRWTAIAAALLVLGLAAWAFAVPAHLIDLPWRMP